MENNKIEINPVGHKLTPEQIAKWQKFIWQPHNLESYQSRPMMPESTSPQLSESKECVHKTDGLLLKIEFGKEQVVYHYLDQADQNINQSSEKSRE